MFAWGSGFTAIKYAIDTNDKEIAEKQIKSFKVHSRNVGEGKMTPEQSLALQKASDQHIFDQHASFLNKNLYHIKNNYLAWKDDFSAPIKIEELQKEEKSFDHIDEVKVLENKLKSFKVEDVE